ncbi:MAG: helix-turn-helix domain-containing protein [Sedimentisphaerales bacterium]|nr:helix-turn-helix domain-containing protein [Sedimentisphaerales bacterium]
MALGQIIRKKRDELGLTLDDVSNRTGYSKPYLSTIETGRVKNPPADELLVKLEKLLDFEQGLLLHIAHLEKLPADVRESFEQFEAENDKLRSVLKKIVSDDPDKMRYLESEGAPNLLERPAAPGIKRDASGAGVAGYEKLPTAGKLVPVINKVTAGYPADYGDLGYPPGGADDYVRCPDLHDANAFAVRVVGDSMEPKFQEGDIIIFSPQAEVRNGDDCFVRLTDPHETTFKQIFFEENGNIRLQPRNHSYTPQILPREKINGLWRAVIKYERLDE